MAAVGLGNSRECFFDVLAAAAPGRLAAGRTGYSCAHNGLLIACGELVMSVGFLDDGAVALLLTLELGRLPLFFALGALLGDLLAHIVHV